MGSLISHQIHGLKSLKVLKTWSRRCLLETQEKESLHMKFFVSFRAHIMPIHLTLIFIPLLEICLEKIIILAVIQLEFRIPFVLRVKFTCLCFVK